MFCETERYLELLSEQGVPVRDLIVNRVEQEHGACEYCRARVQTQRPWLKQIAKTFQGSENSLCAVAWRRKCAELTI